MFKLKEKFNEIYGYMTSDTKIYFSPGRVNLIGEHIDYNGGFVFPAAINLGTYGVVEARKDNIFRFYSTNFEESNMIEIDIIHLDFDQRHVWSNYAKGIIKEFINRGFLVSHGFDLLIHGTLPTASGLSSSASLELLIAWICNDMYSFKLDREYIALLSQHVENSYMGMHCGIMDQLIIAKGEKEKALLMNTATLETLAVPAKFLGYKWVIMNTNYPRKTTDSKYNERRSECDIAVSIIRKFKPIQYLCELSEQELIEMKPYFEDEIIYKRAYHAVTEQMRTIKSKIALENNNPQAFADLLNESHNSLKNNYDVTGFQLDTIVDLARHFGAIGARVTGAGFGGCAIALVPEKALHDFEKSVGDHYFDQTGLKATFYKITFENGVDIYANSKGF